MSSFDSNSIQNSIFQNALNLDLSPKKVQNNPYIPPPPPPVQPKRTYYSENHSVLALFQELNIPITKVNLDIADSLNKLGQALNENNIYYVNNILQKLKDSTRETIEALVILMTYGNEISLLNINAIKAVMNSKSIFDELYELNKILETILKNDLLNIRKKEDIEDLIKKVIIEDQIIKNETKDNQISEEELIKNIIKENFVKEEDIDKNVLDKSLDKETIKKEVIVNEEIVSNIEKTTEKKSQIKNEENQKSLISSEGNTEYEIIMSPEVYETLMIEDEKILINKKELTNEEKILKVQNNISQENTEIIEISQNFEIELTDKTTKEQVTKELKQVESNKNLQQENTNLTVNKNLFENKASEFIRTEQSRNEKIKSETKENKFDSQKINSIISKIISSNEPIKLNTGFIPLNNQEKGDVKFFESHVRNFGISDNAKSIWEELKKSQKNSITIDKNIITSNDNKTLSVIDKSYISEAEQINLNIPKVIFSEGKVFILLKGKMKLKSFQVNLKILEDIIGTKDLSKIEVSINKETIIFRNTINKSEKKIDINTSQYPLLSEVKDNLLSGDNIVYDPVLETELLVTQENKELKFSPLKKSNNGIFEQVSENVFVNSSGEKKLILPIENNQVKIVDLPKEPLKEISLKGNPFILLNSNQIILLDNALQIVPVSDEPIIKSDDGVNTNSVVQEKPIFDLKGIQIDNNTNVTKPNVNITNRTDVNANVTDLNVKIQNTSSPNDVNANVNVNPNVLNEKASIENNSTVSNVPFTSKPIQNETTKNENLPLQNVILPSESLNQESLKTVESQDFTIQIIDPETGEIIFINNSISPDTEVKPLIKLPEIITMDKPLILNTNEGKVIITVDNNNQVKVIPVENLQSQVFIDTPIENVKQNEIIPNSENIINNETTVKTLSNQGEVVKSTINQSIPVIDKTLNTEVIQNLDKSGLVGESQPTIINQSTAVVNSEQKPIESTDKLFVNPDVKTVESIAKPIQNDTKTIENIADNSKTQVSTNQDINYKYETPFLIPLKINVNGLEQIIILDNALQIVPVSDEPIIKPTDEANTNSAVLEQPVFDVKGIQIDNTNVITPSIPIQNTSNRTDVNANVHVTDLNVTITSTSSPNDVNSNVNVTNSNVLTEKASIENNKNVSNVPFTSKPIQNETTKNENLPLQNVILPSESLNQESLKTVESQDFPIQIIDPETGEIIFINNSISPDTEVKPLIKLPEIITIDKPLILNTNEGKVIITVDNNNQVKVIPVENLQSQVFIDIPIENVKQNEIIPNSENILNNETTVKTLSNQGEVVKSTIINNQGIPPAKTEVIQNLDKSGLVGESQPTIINQSTAVVNSEQKPIESTDKLFVNPDVKTVESIAKPIQNDTKTIENIADNSKTQVSTNQDINYKYETPFLIPLKINVNGLEQIIILDNALQIVPVSDEPMIKPTDEANTTISAVQEKPIFDVKGIQIDNNTNVITPSIPIQNTSNLTDVNANVNVTNSNVLTEKASIENNSTVSNVPFTSKPIQNETNQNENLPLKNVILPSESLNQESLKTVESQDFPIQIIDPETGEIIFINNSISPNTELKPLIKLPEIITMDKPLILNTNEGKVIITVDNNNQVKIIPVENLQSQVFIDTSVENVKENEIIPNSENIINNEITVKTLSNQGEVVKSTINQSIPVIDKTLKADVIQNLDKSGLVGESQPTIINQSTAVVNSEQKPIESTDKLFVNPDVKTVESIAKPIQNDTKTIENIADNSKTQVSTNQDINYKYETPFLIPLKINVNGLEQIIILDNALQIVPVSDEPMIKPTNEANTNSAVLEQPIFDVKGIQIENKPNVINPSIPIQNTSSPNDVNKNLNVTSLNVPFTSKPIKNETNQNENLPLQNVILPSESLNQESLKTVENQDFPIQIIDPETGEIIFINNSISSDTKVKPLIKLPEIITIDKPLILNTNEGKVIITVDNNNQVKVIPVENLQSQVFIDIPIENVKENEIIPNSENIINNETTVKTLLNQGEVVQPTIINNQSIPVIDKTLKADVIQNLDKSGLVGESQPTIINQSKVLVNAEQKPIESTDKLFVNPDVKTVESIAKPIQNDTKTIENIADNSKTQPSINQDINYKYETPFLIPLKINVNGLEQIIILDNALQIVPVSDEPMIKPTNEANTNSAVLEQPIFDVKGIQIENKPNVINPSIPIQNTSSPNDVNKNLNVTSLNVPFTSKPIQNETNQNENLPLQNVILPSESLNQESLKTVESQDFPIQIIDPETGEIIFINNSISPNTELKPLIKLPEIITMDKPLILNTNEGKVIITVDNNNQVKIIPVENLQSQVFIDTSVENVKENEIIPNSENIINNEITVKTLSNQGEVVKSTINQSIPVIDKTLNTEVIQNLDKSGLVVESQPTIINQSKVLVNVEQKPIESTNKLFVNPDVKTVESIAKPIQNDTKTIENIADNSKTQPAINQDINYKYETPFLIPLKINVNGLEQIILLDNALQIVPVSDEPIIKPNDEANTNSAVQEQPVFDVKGIQIDNTNVITPSIPIQNTSNLTDVNSNVNVTSLNVPFTNKTIQNETNQNVFLQIEPTNKFTSDKKIQIPLNNLPVLNYENGLFIENNLSDKIVIINQNENLKIVTIPNNKIFDETPNKNVFKNDNLNEYMVLDNNGNIFIINTQELQDFPEVPKNSIPQNKDSIDTEIPFIIDEAGQPELIIKDENEDYKLIRLDEKLLQNPDDYPALIKSDNGNYKIISETGSKPINVIKSDFFNENENTLIPVLNNGVPQILNVNRPKNPDISFQDLDNDILTPFTILSGDDKKSLLINENNIPETFVISDNDGNILKNNFSNYSEIPDTITNDELPTYLTKILDENMEVNSPQIFNINENYSVIYKDSNNNLKTIQLENFPEKINSPLLIQKDSEKYLVLPDKGLINLNNSKELNNMSVVNSPDNEKIFVQSKNLDKTGFINFNKDNIFDLKNNIPIIKNSDNQEMGILFKDNQKGEIKFAEFTPKENKNYYSLNEPVISEKNLYFTNLKNELMSFTLTGNKLFSEFDNNLFKTADGQIIIKNQNDFYKLKMDSSLFNDIKINLEKPITLNDENSKKIIVFQEPKENKLKSFSVSDIPVNALQSIDKPFFAQKGNENIMVLNDPRYNIPKVFSLEQTLLNDAQNLDSPLLANINNKENIIFKDNDQLKLLNMATLPKSNIKELSTPVQFQSENENFVYLPELGKNKVIKFDSDLTNKLSLVNEPMKVKIEGKNYNITPDNISGNHIIAPEKSRFEKDNVKIEQPLKIDSDNKPVYLIKDPDDNKLKLLNFSENLKDISLNLDKAGIINRGDNKTILLPSPENNNILNITLNKNIVKNSSLIEKPLDIKINNESFVVLPLKNEKPKLISLDIDFLKKGNFIEDNLPIKINGKDNIIIPESKNDKTKIISNETMLKYSKDVPDLKEFKTDKNENIITISDNKFKGLISVDKLTEKSEIIDKPFIFEGNNKKSFIAIPENNTLKTANFDNIISNSKVQKEPVFTKTSENTFEVLLPKNENNIPKRLELNTTNTKSLSEINEPFKIENENSEEIVIPKDNKLYSHIIDKNTRTEIPDEPLKLDDNNFLVNDDNKLKIVDIDKPEIINLEEPVKVLFENQSNILFKEPGKGEFKMISTDESELNKISTPVNFEKINIFEFIPGNLSEIKTEINQPKVIPSMPHNIPNGSIPKSESEEFLFDPKNVNALQTDIKNINTMVKKFLEVNILEDPNKFAQQINALRQFFGILESEVKNIRKDLDNLNEEIEEETSESDLIKESDKSLNKSNISEVSTKKPKISFDSLLKSVLTGSVNAINSKVENINLTLLGRELMANNEKCFCIPLSIPFGELKFNGELLVRQELDKETNKKGGKSLSITLAVETKNLEKIVIDFINNEKDLLINIKVNNQKIKNIFDQKLSHLNELLKISKFRIAPVTCLVNPNKERRNSILAPSNNFPKSLKRIEGIV